MEDKYEFTARMELFRGILNGVPLYAALAIVFLAAHIKFPAGSVPDIVVSVIFIIAVLVIIGLNGSVSADAEGISIRIKLLAVPIMTKSYYYDDIKSVSCQAEKYRRKYSEGRRMSFNITLSNGRKLWFTRRLRYSRGRYTSAGCEPMLRLYSYAVRCKAESNGESRPR